MRTLEIRRHSLLKKQPAANKGSDLSQEGVALARSVGDGMGSFHAVYTSPTSRSLETAIAMGHAVTETLDVFGDVPTELLEQLGHHERLSGQAPFSTLLKQLLSDGSMRRLGLLQREAWLSVAAGLPDGKSALVISYGMVIEAGLLASFSGNELGDEASFGYCEGVRLAFDGRTLSAPEFLRIKR